MCCDACKGKSKNEQRKVSCICSNLADMSCPYYLLIDSDWKGMSQKYIIFFINNKFKKLLYFLTCILPDYRTRAIIGRSRFEAALVYKLRILGLKSEEFPF